MNQFEPKFQRFKIGSIKALALFDYDEKMRDLIYRFKGCYDYELRTIFLDMFKRELSLFYKGYTMVPAPSFKDDDLRRGFNHVEEVFRSLKLDMVLAFEKDQQFKQADHNFKERKLIDKHIKLKENIELKDNILLVDDIYTTGSTMNAMISLLKSKGIKKIKVLVLCKTKLNETTKGNLMQ